MEQSKTALLIIDLQNDYFPNGKFPLWDTEETLNNIKSEIVKANNKNKHIIIVQHVADKELGISPFFNEGTAGVEIHSEILSLAPNTKIITKKYADSFEQTELENLLTKLKVTELEICGMMTQNCVTHTAISKKAEKYDVSVITNCCTSVDEMIHNIALHAISTRVKLI